MEIWYCRIDACSDSDLQRLMENCQVDEREQILRFRFLKDRLFRLLGRRMVEMKYKVGHDQFDIAPSGKPFLKTGQKFNISHSGDIVAVAFSEHEVGLDLEQIQNTESSELISYFHPKEIEQLHQAPPEVPIDFFFKIWTRKEAFLKATALGITSGLHRYNCLQGQVSYKGEMWSIKSIDEISGYAIAISSNAELQRIEFREVGVAAFFKG